MAERTAILVRCTEEEAEMIRAAAQRERRTISGFILNAIMNRLQARARLTGEFRQQSGIRSSDGGAKSKKTQA